ncbi:uncharacterized protein LOC114878518 [Osmia bicornis bicornis]|uniref:uncharacterized protein LOC114878518 n=1 Tax=Osmia bicornis bicornis TaxID=1437191 RepID=UPI001EAF7329|nr:uncharacterized protein LOC114878518 [Osmia bicornis bicornis]
MMLRTFYVLCCLWTFTLSENIDGASQSSSSLSPGINNTRDKRALGLILSGLAQVFGYTVDPVQLATLPNPDDAKSTQTSCNNTQNPCMSNQNGSTTSRPPQRETIRLTGVLNFGNDSNILNHLQEYEQIFHGNGSSTTQTPSGPPSTQAPMIDTRAPLLPNISLPSIPQSPLPEIPPQDIKLSYPRPLVLIHRNQNFSNARNKSMTKEQGQQGNDMGSKDTNGSNADKLRWEEYEERLAELERRQQEQAERLRQQEHLRNREKDDNYSSEGNERNRGKQTGHRDEDCQGNEDGNYENPSEEEEEEEEGSRESFKNQQKTDQEEPQESNEEEQSKDDDVYKYGIFGELPISKDDEQRRPEQLRNSYGEPLNNHELTDDGFVNYFSKLKQQNDFRTSSITPNSREETSKENEDESREYDLPARNKYEEYALEEDTDSGMKEDENSEEDDSPPMKYSSKVPSNGDQSFFKDQKINEELDFSKHVPLIIPVRYLTAPEELDKVRLSTTVKSQKDNTVPEATKKVSRKELRPPKKNLKPTIGFPTLPKKLHHGEQKELQMWPPPFDFILDSTIQAGDASGGSSSGKAKPYDKRNGKQGQPPGRMAPPVDPPAPRTYDYPENIYYQSFGKNFESGNGASKQSMFHRPVNDGIMNRTRYEAEEIPDFWQRHRYTLNDDYKNLEEPNLRIKSSVQGPSSDSKRLESSKRSTENIEPRMENYFNQIYPGSRREEDGKNQRVQDFQIAMQNSKSMTVPESPGKDYDYFGVGPNDYDVDYIRRHEKLPPVFANDQRLYQYSESLTKLTSGPESKDRKVAVTDYENAGNAMIALGQEEISSTIPISYISYPDIL